MDKKQCSTCRHFSLLNAFCDKEGVNKKHDDVCYLHKFPKQKCDGCTNDSCDGDCDCGGKCKEKPPEDSNGGCSGCPGGCISLSVGQVIVLDNINSGYFGQYTYSAEEKTAGVWCAKQSGTVTYDGIDIFTSFTSIKCLVRFYIDSNYLVARNVHDKEIILHFRKSK